MRAEVETVGHVQRSRIVCRIGLPLFQGISYNLGADSDFIARVFTRRRIKVFIVRHRYSMFSELLIIHKLNAGANAPKRAAVLISLNRLIGSSNSDLCKTSAPRDMLSYMDLLEEEWIDILRGDHV